MKGRKWNKIEDEILRKIYPRFLLREISRDSLERIFNRSIQSIYKRASLLNLTNQDVLKTDFNELKKYLFKDEIEKILKEVDKNDKEKY
ncbi:MAG TPA: hypothetical protein PKV21_09440 [bacterium]|nr:hypothetical protein [bacterium]